VARYVRRLRQAQGVQPGEQRPGHLLSLVVEVQPQPLTTRRVTRLVLKRPKQRTEAETQLIACLPAQHRDLAATIALAQDFCAIVRERQADRFDDWLAHAVTSAMAALQRFATGLCAGYEAVAGMMLPSPCCPLITKIA
jgi:transposase